MAHFAALDADGVVTAVVVLNDMLLLNENGAESEALGIAYLTVNVNECRWVQTSYNGRIRRRFAGIGMTYSDERDAFLFKQPFPSWSLNENHDWCAPIPKPDDGGLWAWDEQGQQWAPVPSMPVVETLGE